MFWLIQSEYCYLLHKHFQQQFYLNLMCPYSQMQGWSVPLEIMCWQFWCCLVTSHMSYSGHRVVLWTRVQKANHLSLNLKALKWPWLVWLSGSGTVLQTKSVGWLDSWSEHMPGLRARSPVEGVWEATNRCFSCTWMFLSLTPLPFLQK